jgi:hypothetical protein
VIYQNRSTNVPERRQLVAQLDQLNGWMLLTQPHFTMQSDRDKMMERQRILADSLVRNFEHKGVFSGVSITAEEKITREPRYKTRHTDFGHTLKAYWMLHKVDKRLPDHPYSELVSRYTGHWIELAFDRKYGRWSERMVDFTTAGRTGVMWWTYCEMDQVAATMTMNGSRYTRLLEKTTANWLNDFVDPVNGEVYTAISRNGTPRFVNGPRISEWKNGYHSSEHALVMYLFGCWLEHKEATLYFAVPDEESSVFTATPYTFMGVETLRTREETIPINDVQHTITAISFKSIY